MKIRVLPVVDKNNSQKYEGQNSKKSPSQRSAEGAERRDSFICCGVFGAAGAEGAKNMSTAQEHEYSRSSLSRERVEAPDRQHKATNTQHMARIYQLQEFLTARSRGCLIARFGRTGSPMGVRSRLTVSVRRHLRQRAEPLRR